MLLRDATAVESTSVEAADGLSKAVVIGEDDGAPHFALRRFTLEAGGSVPKHTNEIEHVQYVLTGEYRVGHGTGDDATERRVSPGDALLIPAGTVHWYVNDSSEQVAFLCAVPHGDDEIVLHDA